MATGEVATTQKPGKGQSKKREGGRPRLDPAEEKRRMDIYNAYMKSKATPDITKESFCNGYRYEIINVSDLDKIIDWVNQRNRRLGKGAKQ